MSILFHFLSSYLFLKAVQILNNSLENAINASTIATTIIINDNTYQENYIENPLIAQNLTLEFFKSFILF